MISKDTQILEWDFFLDEDIRNQKVGLLCTHKEITPILQYRLFKVREKSQAIHKQRISSDEPKDKRQKKAELKSVITQIREIKWSSLNVMRSFIAQGFLKEFFRLSQKHTGKVVFVTTDFQADHLNSIQHLFSLLSVQSFFSQIHVHKSILFVDDFTSPKDVRFEKEVRKITELARCFRIDSRAHDLIQLADLLLGVTVYMNGDKITKSSAKIRVVDTFQKLQKTSQTELLKYSNIITIKAQKK